MRYTEMMQFSKIILPTRPQPDTIVGIFILKKYGATFFPGIESVSYEILPQTDHGVDEKQYLQKGMILVDVGGGIFDHHNRDKKTTASQLIAEALGVNRDASIQKMLAYAERDDFYGKGTQSDDPLDKAFGLSGLIAALNKAHPNNQTLVINSVLPLLDAHHQQERNRVEELPKELAVMKEKGLFEEQEVIQKKNKLKLCFVESDNVGLPGFLRATDGGKFDIVVQRRTSGHVNILTRPLKRPDLRNAAALIRSKEYEVRSSALYPNPDTLGFSGRNDDVPMWYFDPATNSLQNGGVNPGQVEPTVIAWSDMKMLVKKGIEAV